MPKKTDPNIETAFQRNERIRVKVLGGVPVAARFSRKEIWAMWVAVCDEGGKAPFTFVLKKKLYELLTSEEHDKFYKKYEKQYERNHLGRRYGHQAQTSDIGD